MSAQQPGAGPAHGEAGEGGAPGIDLFLVDEELADIEDVLLAGSFITDAVAAPGMDDDGAGGLEFTALFHALVDEVEVGAGVAAPLEPEPGGGVLFGGVVRDFEAEGLGGTVDIAVITTDHEAGGGEPGGAFGGEVGDAAVGFGEEVAGFAGVLGFVELFVFDGVADGFEKDLGVGVVGLFGEGVEACGEGFEGGGEPGAVGVGEFIADGRDDPVRKGDFGGCARHEQGGEAKQEETFHVRARWKGMDSGAAGADARPC